jgi:hypothetical protein
MLSENFYFSIVSISVYKAFSWKFTESRSYSIARNDQIWSLLKLLFLGTNANLIIILNLSNSSKAHLIKRSTTASRAVSDSDFSMFDRCPKVNPTPYSQTESSVCRPLINSYSTRPNISCPNRTQNPVSTTILKYHDSPSPTKNRSRSSLKTIYFQITRRELFPSEFKSNSRPN